jgi:flavin-binding protein dodecin
MAGVLEPERRKPSAAVPQTGVVVARARHEGARAMAIHKVIEVLSQSDKSWEDAAQRAIKDAAKTVKNIRSIWVKNFEGVVKNDKIVEYRVNANITFEVK